MLVLLISVCIVVIDVEHHLFTMTEGKSGVGVVGFQFGLDRLLSQWLHSCFTERASK